MCHACDIKSGIVVGLAANAVILLVIVLLTVVVQHDLEDACYNPEPAGALANGLADDDVVRKEERSLAVLYTILGFSAAGLWFGCITFAAVLHYMRSQKLRQ